MDGSFVFYESFMDAVEEIPEDLQLEALKALIMYGLHGEVKRHPANPFATVILTMAKPVIDANAERRKNGAKGGRPPKTNGYENEKPMVIDEETVGNDVSESAKPNEDEDVDVDANGDVNGEGDEKIAPAHVGGLIGLIAYGRYRNVLLTQKEYDAFCKENPDNGLDVIEKLSAHMASTGRQYQNHHATLEKWMMQDRERRQELQPKNDALNYKQRKDDMMDVFMDL